MISILSLLLAGAIIAQSTFTFAADAPAVVASIKPVHSLVSAVMAGVGAPALIVQGGGSPHTYALKPSEARALQQADVVFWIGPALEAFLERPVETLGTDATIVTLGDSDGLTKLAFREGGPFEAHDHEKAEHHHGEAAQEEGHGHGGEHVHTDEKEHAHGDGEVREHGHGHGGTDMHLWLDPENAKVMAGRIAAALAAADPDHAATYAANAEALQARLDALKAEIADELAPVRDRPFVVFHDAYRYFENRFGVTAVGSITVSPEAAPGAQRLRDIHDKIGRLGAACVFAEPQFEPKLIAVVTEGTDARAGVLDPLGAELADGPDLYFELIRAMATSLKQCLGEPG